MERKFKAVGWSTLNGALKLRFTTDKYRQKVLERNGHEDVRLFELSEEMSKEDAAHWLLDRRDVPAHVKQLARKLLDENQQVEEIVQAAAKVTEQSLKKGPGKPRATRSKQAAHR